MTGSNGLSSIVHRPTAVPFPRSTTPPLSSHRARHHRRLARHWPQIDDPNGSKSTGSKKSPRASRAGRRSPLTHLLDPDHPARCLAPPPPRLHLRRDLRRIRRPRAQAPLESPRHILDRIHQVHDPLCRAIAHKQIYGTSGSIPSLPQRPHLQHRVILIRTIPL